MRLSAVLAAAASLCGGCFQSRTVDCGNGFLCPPDQACAAPGHCGDPVQVASCDGKADWDPCAFSDTTGGSCRFGVCEACTPDRAGCGSGWRAMSSSTTVDLNDILVLARDDAYAVGNTGTLLHYDGTQWRAVATSPAIPSTLDLQSIWGPTGDDFYVVSSDAGDRNVLHITARTQLGFETMTSYGLKAVWGTARDNVFVVGLGGLVRRFDGTGWQDVRSGGLPLTKIDGLVDQAVMQIVAIGPSGSYAASVSGGWSSGMLSSSTTLTDVWVGADATLVVGLGRTLLRYITIGNAQPVSFDATVPIGLDLYGAWGSATAKLVVGDAGKILRSDTGEQWTDASPNLGSSSLRAIDGSGEGDIFVVGAAGAIWHFSE
jgi:hypothetical protein